MDPISGPRLNKICYQNISYLVTVPISDPILKPVSDPIAGPIPDTISDLISHPVSDLILTEPHFQDVLRATTVHT